MRVHIAFRCDQLPALGGCCLGFRKSDAMSGCVSVLYEYVECARVMYVYVDTHPTL